MEKGRILPNTGNVVTTKIWAGYIDFCGELHNDRNGITMAIASERLNQKI